MRALLLRLTVFAILGLSMPAAAWTMPDGAIDIGSLQITARPLKRGITLDPRKPRAAAPEEATAKPGDLVRKSFRRALLRTASSL